MRLWPRFDIQSVLKIYNVCVVTNRADTRLTARQLGRHYNLASADVCGVLLRWRRIRIVSREKDPTTGILRDQPSWSINSYLGQQNENYHSSQPPWPFSRSNYRQPTITLHCHIRVPNGYPSLWLLSVLQILRRGTSQQRVEGMTHTGKEPCTCSLDSSASVEQKNTDNLSLSFLANYSYSYIIDAGNTNILFFQNTWRCQTE